MRRRTVLTTLAVGVAAVGFSDRLWGQEDATPSAAEIVERANRTGYYQGDDGRAKAEMKIIDAKGNVRNRKFAILRKDAPPPKDATADLKAPDVYCGDQKFYLYFQLPADVRKTTFLVHKHLKGDDDRWLYLPDLDLKKRIVAAEKRTSFVGSHFFYEDVSGRNINDDKHELVKTTKNYYVLKNTPKDPKSVEFAYYEMWVIRGSFIVGTVNYFDAKGEKYRVYTAIQVKILDKDGKEYTPEDAAKVKDDVLYPTVTKSQMADSRTGGKTVLEYTNVKYNTGLPDEVFTERYLKNPPRKYLK